MKKLQKVFLNSQNKSNSKPKEFLQTLMLSSMAFADKKIVQTRQEEPYYRIVGILGLN